MSGPSADIQGWCKLPKAILRSPLTPTAKLVYAAIAGELYDRETVEMTHGEIGACCHIGERQVRRCLRCLIAHGFIEQRRLSAGCVNQYRLLRQDRTDRTKQADADRATGVQAADCVSMPVCGECHRRRKHLSRSGVCRGCKADMDMAVRVRTVRAELGSTASPEQIAERLNQVAGERRQHRLVTRVRRAIEDVA